MSSIALGALRTVDVCCSRGERVRLGPKVRRNGQRIDPLADPGQAKKPVAESSRVAAADMLKQFFQNRRS